MTLNVLYFSFREATPKEIDRSRPVMGLNYNYNVISRVKPFNN
jgi:hypothetical protein